MKPTTFAEPLKGELPEGYTYYYPFEDQLSIIGFNDETFTVVAASTLNEVPMMHTWIYGNELDYFRAKIEVFEYMVPTATEEDPELKSFLDKETE